MTEQRYAAEHYILVRVRDRHPGDNGFSKVRKAIHAAAKDGDFIVSDIPVRGDRPTTHYGTRSFWSDVESIFTQLMTDAKAAAKARMAVSDCDAGTYSCK